MRNATRRLIRQLRRYKQIQRIGGGGAAIVYSAKAPSGEKIALKWYIAGDDLKKGKIRRSSLSQLFQLPYDKKELFSHPNIVTIIETGRVNPAPYIVMEFVSGGNLRDRHLSQARLHRCFIEIADALEKLHGQGYIHREPKLENIVVDRNRAVLVDCDLIVKQPYEDEDRIGSADYLTPEHASEGRCILTDKTDVHILTAAIYAAMNGGSTALDRRMMGLRRINTEQYELRLQAATAIFLTGYDVSLPKEIKVKEREKWNRLFEAGLAREPENRPDMSGLKELIDDAFGSNK